MEIPQEQEFEVKLTAAEIGLLYGMLKTNRLRSPDLIGMGMDLLRDKLFYSLQGMAGSREEFDKKLEALMTIFEW